MSSNISAIAQDAVRGRTFLVVLLALPGYACEFCSRLERTCRLWSGGTRTYHIWPGKGAQLCCTRCCQGWPCMFTDIGDGAEEGTYHMQMNKKKRISLEHLTSGLETIVKMVCPLVCSTPCSSLQHHFHIYYSTLVATCM